MELQKRKPNRLKNYDYSQNGAYFITICTNKRKCILSTIDNDKSNQNDISTNTVSSTNIPNASKNPVGNAVLGVPQTNAKNDISTNPVGNAVLGVPNVKLTHYGKATEKIILQMQNFYENINIDCFVIMPNHLHLIISINDSGVPRTAHPTVSRFIGTMKRFINKDIGENIWQKSFYDHIIRDDEDYSIKRKYIDENPLKWHDDELFCEQT